MTLKEAAARLGYKDASTLRQAIRRGQLKPELIGTTYLLKEEELQAYLEVVSKTGRPRGKPGRPRRTTPPDQEQEPTP